MSLELEDVVPYLLEQRLLRPRAVVDGRLRVVDMSRLNHVFVVTANHEPCLVVKCAGTTNPGGVARERAVLERLRSSVDHSLLSGLPAPVHYDEGADVLVLEANRDAIDLRRYAARGRLSRTLARGAGTMLALLHATPVATLSGLPEGPDITGTLRIHRPTLDLVRATSAASVEVIRIMQGSEQIAAGLDQLLTSWRTDSLIHGDIRWDNWLALKPPATARRTRLMLIDWELAGPGDHALDVGAFLAEYLLAWLRSLAIVAPNRVDEAVGYAGVPLRRLHDAISTFWAAYSRVRGSGTMELSRTLRRAVRFAGARLLVVALEEARSLVEPNQGIRYILQLGGNVLARPDEAAAHLLGLRSSSRHP